MPPDGASAWERVRALLGGGARAVAKPDPGGEYGPEAENLGPLRFLSSVPGGPQMAAGAQALGATLRGDADSFSTAYEHHRRRNDEALKALSEKETSDGWRAASLLPYLTMGPAAQAAYGGAAAASRGGSPGEVALEAGANLIPGGRGPGGPLVVGATRAVPRPPAAQIAGAPFKAWFGESSVVDKKSRPLTVHHGTTSEFEEFVPGGDMGFHFTPKKSVARSVADARAGEAQRNAGEVRSNGAAQVSGKPRIISAFLSIKRPLRMRDMGDWKPDDVLDQLYEDGVITEDEWLSNQRPRVNDVIRLIESKGYDGVVYENDYEGSGGDSFMAFRPEQIKSATHNRGTFDAGDPNFLHGMAPALPVNDDEPAWPALARLLSSNEE